MAEPTGPDFDLLASSIRSDAGDLRTYLEVVAGKLADSLPGSVKIERDGGVFARQRRVQRVTLTLEGRAYVLAWTGSDLQATIDGGVLPVDRWALALGRHLEDHAQSETQSRAAMEALVEGRLPAQLLSRPDPRPVVARHPVTSFSPDSNLQIGPSDAGVLLTPAAAIGPVGPGLHRAGDLVAAADQPVRTLQATIYFVSMADLASLRFGGAGGGVRAYGIAQLRVVDPVGLVRLLAGRSGAEIPDEAVAGVARDAILTALARLPAAARADLTGRVLGELGAQAGSSLVEIVALPDLNVSWVEAAPPAPSPAPEACPRCGAPDLPGSRFCAQCGAPLRA